MVQSFGVPPEDISYYAGMTAASFSLSQFFTSVLWSRLSDRFGRKPIILLGLATTLTSLLLFGFSTTLPMAISARALAGLVNGNVGILRTMVAEMVPEKQLQPRAFSIMPLVYNIASIVGPMVGGALADPLKNHPEWFHGSRPALFEKFPFALPNLVCAGFFLIGIPIGILFLDETMEDLKDKKDVGRELGKKLTKWIDLGRHRRNKTISDEAAPLLSGAVSTVPEDEEVLNPQPKKPNTVSPFMDAFTVQSTMNIVYYMLLALHSVTFDQLMPVFLSYPHQDQSEWNLPFKFAGGFGLPSSQVGKIFSVYGILAMLLQFFLFPPMANWLGALWCLRIVAFIAPVVYAAVPFALLLPPHLQFSGIYILMFFKGLSTTFAFPCSVVLLTNSSPSLKLLGTLNGVAVAFSSLMRGIGPAIGGIVFSHGQKSGYLILPWMMLSGVALLATVPFLWMNNKGGIGGDDTVESNSGSEDGQLENGNQQNEQQNAADEEAEEENPSNNTCLIRKTTHAERAATRLKAYSGR